MDNDSSRVRSEALRLLASGKRSIRPRDIMDTLDMPLRPVARELATMRKERLIEGKSKIMLYWLPQLDGKRPLIVSIVPTIQGERREDYKSYDIISPNAPQDQVGDAVAQCLDQLTCDGYTAGDGKTISLFVRLS